MVQGYGCHQKITGRPCHEGSDEVIGRGPSPFCFRSVLKFRHEGARGFGLGRFRLGAQDNHACGKASSRTREKQAMTTRSAPARFNADTQASLVAPLVRTSSTNTIFAPRSRSR